MDAVRALATAPNQRVVVVPIEAAALAGTLGGIGELTREVFGEAAARPGAPARRRMSAEWGLVIGAIVRSRRSDGPGTWILDRFLADGN